MKRSNFFNFFPRKSNIYTKEWFLDDFSFLLRYITYVWLNFYQNWILGHFWTRNHQNPKNWAKMAFILLDRAKNIWNISIKWKNALCSIKSRFSRGVAKRTPPGAQASKITLVLKGLSLTLWCFFLLIFQSKFFLPQEITLNIRNVQV